MTSYRRNYLDGGSYFFTVNLVQRRSRLLTGNIGLLRSAFRYTRARHADYIHTNPVKHGLHNGWWIGRIPRCVGLCGLAFIPPAGRGGGGWDESGAFGEP